MVHNLAFTWALNTGKVFLSLGFWSIENTTEFPKLAEIHHDSLLSEPCLLLLFKTQVQLIKKAYIIFL